MKKTIYTSIISICLTVLVNTVYAQPGELDLTFGDYGKVTTAIGSSDDRGSSTAIQTDGKIIVVGYSNNGSNNDFALVRYNADGSLDNTFGSDGIVTTDFDNGYDYGNAIAIQSDGKIVIVGSAFIEDGGYSGSKFALARYNIDGSLDYTFGLDGLVSTDIAFDNDYGTSIDIQSDGKIVAGGYYNNYGPTEFALIRYNIDGTLDNSFGTGGIVTTDFIGTFSYGYSVAIQSDNKILLAGESGYESFPDFALARYNSDGSLDNSFGSGGKVTTHFESTSGSSAMVIQIDGKIILAGDKWDDMSNQDFVLARYNSDGSLDNTFGIGGQVITDLGSNYDKGRAIALQTDAKIIVSGSSYNGVNDDFALVRYNIDGSLDNTFGTGGIVTTNFGSDDDISNCIVILTDGKIVTAGFSYVAGNNVFLLAKYNGDETVAIQGELFNTPFTISVSPNPFSTELKITIKYCCESQTKGIKSGEAILFDAVGNEILRQIISTSETIINTENLSSGFYLLNYIVGSKSENYVVIKN